MKTKEYLLTSVLTVSVLAASAIGIVAQSKIDKMKGKPMDMAKMMKSPHHMLMMAHMKSMSEFAKALHHEAMMAKVLDVEFARSSVAELRHNLDAMEAIHQKHMATMSDEMKAKMKMMMDKMEKGQATTKEHVTALETAVQSDQPDSKQVAMHANALLKHFGMMSKMHGGSTSGKKKMAMKKKMTMKPM